VTAEAHDFTFESYLVEFGDSNRKDVATRLGYPRLNTGGGASMTPRTMDHRGDDLTPVRKLFAEVRKAIHFRRCVTPSFQNEFGLRGEGL
jgi:hypothetical protein